MNIHFVTNLPPNNSDPLKNYPVDLAPIDTHSCRQNYRVPSVNSSEKSDLPSSPSLLFALSQSPVNNSSDLHPESDYHSSPNSNSAPSPQKVSRAWQKTFDDYFKSDDESSILSPEDEWWLNSSRPILDQREPPSGKTRLPKNHDDKDENISDSLEFDTQSISSFGEPEYSSPIPHESPNQNDSASNFVTPPTLSDSNFPSLPNSNLTKSKHTSNHHLSKETSRVKVSSISKIPSPWNSSCTKALSPTPDFPSLTSSLKPTSTPAPRLICSFSSACQQASAKSNPSDVPPTNPSPKNLKKSLMSSREDSLRSSLPPFKLFDPNFKPVTISLCPSDQYPLTELPKLINLIRNDGIQLPSGKTELEGGPYIAVAFDMEWEISYVRGRENKTALIQLGSQSRALMIQLSRVETWRRNGIMPQPLVDFLLDPQIVKLGVGIRNDGSKLLRDHKYGPKPYLNSFFEISRLSKSLGPLECATGFSRLVSLQRIVANHLKVYLPKDTVRISDWTKSLTSDQKNYAASDVIATIRVTQTMFELFEETNKSKTGQYILDFIESLEPSFERDESFRAPVIPSSKEWRTIQPVLKDFTGKKLSRDQSMNHTKSPKVHTIYKNSKLRKNIN